MHLDWDLVDVEEVIEQSVEANGPYAASFGVRIAVECVGSPLLIWGDRRRFGQVLENLLSNAAKFSPVGEVVVVSAGVRDGKVRVAVTDRGPGIPDDFRDHVFEKFRQADTSDARDRGGVGLGLSISRAIIESLGGNIWFDTVPGDHTTFFVEMPVRE